MQIEEKDIRRRLAAFEDAMLSLGNIIESVESTDQKLAAELDGIYDVLSDFQEFVGDFVSAEMPARSTDDSAGRDVT